MKTQTRPTRTQKVRELSALITDAMLKAQAARTDGEREAWLSKLAHVEAERAAIEGELYEKYGIDARG